MEKYYKKGMQVSDDILLVDRFSLEDKKRCCMCADGRCMSCDSDDAEDSLRGSCGREDS